MLFPCGFGVFPKSQPRPQDFGRSYNPYGSFGEEVPKTLARSALPSAVILDGVHLQPRPFHLLDFRSSKIERNARKIALFYLVRNTAETGLVRWSVGVCSTSAVKAPHRATRWLTGGHILALLHPHHRGFVLILVGSFILGFFGRIDLFADEGLVKYFFSAVRSSVVGTVCFECCHRQIPQSV